MLTTLKEEASGTVNIVSHLLFVFWSSHCERFKYDCFQFGNIYWIGNMLTRFRKNTYLDYLNYRVSIYTGIKALFWVTHSILSLVIIIITMVQLRMIISVIFMMVMRIMLTCWGPHWQELSSSASRQLLSCLAQGKRNAATTWNFHQALFEVEFSD